MSVISVFLALLLHVSTLQPDEEGGGGDDGNAK
jgi:hypothetical protein